MAGGDDPFYLRFWVGATGPRSSEIVDVEPRFARRASAVTPSENTSFNTNIDTVLTSEPKMNIVRCP